MVKTKVALGNRLVTILVAGRLPWNNGRSHLTQFIAISNTLIPAGLPSGVDGSLKRAEVLAAHMRGDPAEGNRFVVGMKVIKEPLDF